LSIHEGPITGFWQFECSDQRCGFIGDAAALVSRVRNLKLEEAVGLFRPGKELAHTLIPDVGGSQLDDYLSDLSSQTRLAAYLNRTNQALRSPAGERLRQKMSEHGAAQRGAGSSQEPPKTLGMVLTTDVPPTLRELETLKKYRDGCYAIYPRTYNGRIVSVVVQNFNDCALPSKIIPITRSDIGVFMEDNLTGAESEIFVTHSELIACVLYRKFSAMTTKLPPVVALGGLPLPAKCNKLKRINVLSTKEAPLSLEQALGLFAEESVVEGYKGKIKIDVMDMLTEIDKVKINMFESKVYDPHRNNVHALPHWLTTRINFLLTSNQLETVYRAFDRIPLTDEHKQELLQIAHRLNADPKTVQFLETCGPANRAILRLGNGQELIQTPTGLVALKPNGNESTLSNVPLKIEECIYTRSGDMQYTCKFRTAEDVIVSIPLQRHDFTRADVLQTAVHKALASRGHSTYAAFYEQRGYRWGDILCCLAQHKPIRREIVKLGADEFGQVHFPKVTLDLTKRQLEAQECIFTLNNETKSIYAGLEYESGDIDSDDTLKNFVQRAPEFPGAIGLLIGLCHIIYQLLTDVSASRRGTTAGPRHLFYVEPEPGLWSTVYRQLVQLISGVSELPQIPSTRTLAHLDELSQLGALPCTKLLPVLPLKSLIRTVTDSPVSLISLIDNDTAMALTGDAKVSFVTLPDPTQLLNTHIQNEDIAALQKALPSCLLAILSASLDAKAALEFRTTIAPAATTYKYLCEKLGIEASDSVTNLIKQYYTVKGVSNAYAFLHAFAELYEHSKYRYQFFRTVSHYPTKELLAEENTPSIFVTPEQVFISRDIVDVVNRKTHGINVFNTASLTYEFERYKYFVPCPVDVPLDTERYWVLDRKVWDKYVMREPLVLLAPVAQGNIIQLPRLTA
jgi:hypothetical protein